MHRNASLVLKSIAKLPLISVVRRGDPGKLLRYVEHYITADFTLQEQHSPGRRKGMKMGTRGCSERAEDPHFPLARLVAVPGEAARPHTATRDPPFAIGSSTTRRAGRWGCSGARLAPSEQPGTGAQAWEPRHARPCVPAHPGEKALDGTVDTTCGARLPEPR